MTHPTPPSRHPGWPASADAGPLAVQAANAPEQARPAWPTNLVLFVVTVVSVFFAGAAQVVTPEEASGLIDLLRPQVLVRGWVFAVPLMSILLAHEFGHYIAARVHRVSASLPYFIPLPALSPLGTMGAVISMKGRIQSRRALLDIGAAGPLAGMAVAVPVLVWGLLHSPVLPITGHGMLEGQSILYWMFKRLTVGPIPDGHDVFLHPTAFAGWAGLLVTMINLIPVGQLDGGHIAYALLGPLQNRVARIVHHVLPAVFAAVFGWQVLTGTAWKMAFSAALPWLVWWGMLFVLLRLSGRDHPPTEPGKLGSVRTVIAVGSLLLFVLIFMPMPMSEY